MTEDRRQSQRKRVLRRGRIVFRNGYSVIDCVVLDLSEGGARLKLNDWLGLPTSFELRIENGPSHQVTVCYHVRDVTGVRFIDSAAA